MLAIALHLVRLAAITSFSAVIGCGTADSTSSISSSSHQGRLTGEFKLSSHDLDISTPQISVGRDGVIHAAFTEAIRPGVENYVYYRSSGDGGKSWSPAKNLSEVMPGLMVGHMRLTLDGQSRPYVIWASAPEANLNLSGNSHANSLYSNLVYRMLDGGGWSAVQHISTPVDHLHQNSGAGSFFAGTDPGGKVHVAYATNTDIFHPEYMLNAGGPYAMHQANMGAGVVAQVDLNGSTHSSPREVFMTQVTTNGKNRTCDHLDCLDGYFDASGQAHFIAQTNRAGDPQSPSRIDIVENGRQSAAVSLPSRQYEQYNLPPYLLHDAQGRNHVIANVASGEHHSVCDYAVGGNGEPIVIRQEASVIYPIRGFQAFQGPQGIMMLLMEMDDTGVADHGDLFFSNNVGKGWAKPSQLTTYEKSSTETYKKTGTRGSVATIGHCDAGPNSAAAYDLQGHLVLLQQRDQFGSFGVNGFGVQLAGGGSKSETLLFHRF